MLLFGKIKETVFYELRLNIRSFEHRLKLIIINDFSYSKIILKTEKYY